MDPFLPKPPMGPPAPPGLPPMPPPPPPPPMMPPMGGPVGPVGGPDPMLEPQALPGMDPMTGMPVEPPPLGPMPPEEPIFAEPPAEEIPPVIKVGPTLPRWYRKPSRPKPEDVLHDAQVEKEDHQQRLDQIDEMIDVLNGARIGRFERDEELIEAGEIEVFRITDIVDEHNSACTWVAGMDVSFEAKSRDVVDRDEAAAKEDFLMYLYERWSARHAEAGFGSLQWALADILQRTGMICTWIRDDPNDPELGLDIRMIDPASVFPIYEGVRGLAKVFRVYRGTAADVIGYFGDDEGAVERKVRKIARSETTGKYDHRYQGEIVEYYDRHWAMVCFEGEMIRTWEHGLGQPPFVITPGCFGQQGFTRAPGARRPWNRYDILRGVIAVEPHRSEDLARIYQPFLFRRLRAHYQEEALAGRLMTMARRTLNPPTVLKQGLLSQQDGIPDIDTSEGGTTAIRDDDALEPFPYSPDPHIYQPLMMLVGQNRQTGMPPSLVMGQGIPAQTSGTAIDIAAQNGLEKWTPLVLCVEAHLTHVGQRALEIVRDWGDILGGEGNLGVIEVPKRNPAKGPDEISPFHELTPEIVRRTGTRVSARMSKFNPLTLGAVANALIMLKSMNAIDQRSVIRIAGFDPDIEGVLQRIEEDLLNEVPEIKQSKTLRTLKKQALRALALDDKETAEEIAMEALYVGGQMQLSSLAKLKMIAGASDPPMNAMQEMPMGPDGMPLPPGVAPPPPGPGGMPGMQGASIGTPTGTNGGRPPGMGGMGGPPSGPPGMPSPFKMPPKTMIGG